MKQSPTRSRSEGDTPKYKTYGLHNFREIPQLKSFTEEQRFAMEVVGTVLPFKTNNYVINELINWDNVPDDPIFVLTFPQKEMLRPDHFDQMASVMKRDRDRQVVAETANKIRLQLNPHPAGQMEHNVPMLGDQKLHGMQHKYKETVLFFPSQGQTCHAYCTFCFRWPQFVGMEGMKFAMKEAELLVAYVREHTEVSDILFTGGDPMIMTAKHLASYIDPLIEARLPNLQRIRIGTKALAYWPYKFLTDKDAEETLALFKHVVDSGIHLAVMAHFNHNVELETEAARMATDRVRKTGAQIRTQSPVLAHINDDPAVWAAMWKEQVNLGMVPYYMFVVRDTGAQHYFGVPLVRAWQIYREAYQTVSGLSRTVRGPSMSANPGKVQVLGVGNANGQKVITMRMLQGRNPDWVLRPFFAEYDENAIWLDDLKPAFGEGKFFFEEELQRMYHEDLSPESAFNLE
ncbi:MAG: lysine 2,3-aminomutase [Ignavibacteriae bacterium]|nr:lysine 2,3-aminomutase [Ignavibacteriota bacterium]